ncbi:MAG: PA2779 family protein [Syntrophobacterales bacterium]|nr:PA2779 family protein [Syntrophobacterales bacterium]
MLKRFKMPLLALSMAAYLVFLMGFPAVAGLIPSIPSSIEMVGKSKEAEIEKVQKVLEMQIVADKLQAYGLSAEEVKAKLHSMSDEQLQLMAQASDRVLAGGDGAGFVIAVLVIIILVIVILKLLDKRIIIK